MKYQEILGNTKKYFDIFEVFPFQEIPKNFRKYLEISGNTYKFQEILGNIRKYQKKYFDIFEVFPFFENTYIFFFSCLTPRVKHPPGM
jgi:hypothetical protein